MPLITSTCMLFSEQVVIKKRSPDTNDRWQEEWNCLLIPVKKSTGEIECRRCNQGEVGVSRLNVFGIT